MTILELGALGEFFGSIVVFVTLIYVALQIRLARRDASPAVIARMNVAIKGFYDGSYGKVFWETQPTHNVEKDAIRYIETVLAAP